MGSHRAKSVPGYLSYEPLCSAFAEAGRFDQTVSISSRIFPKLAQKFVPPIPYSREALFTCMLAGEPCVLDGFPIPTRGRIGNLPPREAGIAIIEWLANRSETEKYSVSVGSSRKRRELTLREIALMWRSSRIPSGITDLQIRDTELEQIIDPQKLSAFNILRSSSLDARANEIFSLVVSSRGRVTDSHSDDPDSSNFCFVGRKLWLAWDTYEGLEHGLEDVERINIPAQASFDVETWLSLRSARWLFVGSGETLFMPAHLTHKVITIEPYVGVGGFFVALPNCLRLLGHWISKGPLWSKGDSIGENDELIGEICESVRKKILHLRGGSKSVQRKWGYDYLEQSAKMFISKCLTRDLRDLLRDDRFRRVADVVPGPWQGRMQRLSEGRASGNLKTHW
jgi:hypothetical protein